MAFAARRAARRARTIALLSSLPLPLLGAGCSALKSRFPSHEDVFKPVPLTIGELRVEGKDSVYVLAGRSYEIVAPSREMLSDAQSAIDAVQRAYERYLGAEPRPIVVRLQPVRRGDGRDRSRAERDSAARAVRPVSRDERGRRVVVIPVFVSEDRRRGGPGGPDMPMSTFLFGDRFVAQAWIAAYADGVSADSAARLPDWLVSGVSQLLAPRPGQEYMLGRLNDRQRDLIPLRTLFDSVRAPASFGTAGVPPDEEDPDRRMRGMQPPESRNRPAPGPRGDLFAAQSLAVAQFLVEREGPAILGRLAERLTRGERPAAAFGETRTLPHDIDAIDGQFRSWLEEMGSRTRRPRG